MLLEMDGYTAETFRPHVALLDIGMPDMSGHEVARSICRAAWGSKMHLIAATGWPHLEDRERPRVSGFDTHLTEPVDLDQLSKLLQKINRVNG